MDNYIGFKRCKAWLTDEVSNNLNDVINPTYVGELLLEPGIVVWKFTVFEFRIQYRVKKGNFGHQVNSALNEQSNHDFHCLLC